MAYVYVIRVAGILRYVGKGNQGRITQHLRFARNHSD